MSNAYGSRWLPKWKRLAIYIRDEWQCAYCKADLSTMPAYRVTLDHLVPRSLDGSHEAENLITACTSCNSARQDKPLTQFCDDSVLAHIAAQISKPLNKSLAMAIINGKGE